MTIMTELTAAQLNEQFTPQDMLGLNGPERKAQATQAYNQWENTMRVKYMYGFSEERMQDILNEACRREMYNTDVEKEVIRTCELIRAQGITH